MRRTLCAAAGAFVLAAAGILPSGPALADTARAQQQWYLKALKVAQAQAITTGSGVTVAVLDTGVYPHRDFRRNVLSGHDVTPGGKDDGRIDTDGHGTGMAGLVAGRGQNNNAMLGIAPSAKVLPVRLSLKEKNSPPTLMGQAIDWARSKHVGVINLSVGTTPAFQLIDAVHNAEKANIVVVSAAGNEGSPLVSYPAAIYGVLAVGATGRNGKHMSLSNVGSAVQICAPGEKVFTTGEDNKYYSVTGTSPSTAIVSGAVALVRAKFPQLSAAEVIHRITATADDIGAPGRDDECGFGELDIVKALTADVPPLGGASAGASASPSATTVAPAPATNGEAAPGPTEKKGSSGPLIVGVVVVVVVVAGLVGFVLVRRQRRV